jgi:hypothetical protein
MIVLQVRRHPETFAQQGAPDERPETSGRRDDVFFDGVERGYIR